MSINNNLYNVSLHNFEKNYTINNAIADRNIPSTNLTMNFSFRPVNTKYTLMPTVNQSMNQCMNQNINSHVNNYGVFDMSNTFYPGTRKPHFSGFATNVDKESSMRNQFYALQKADQAVYVPNSKSDLYENNINFITHNNNIDNNLLFNEERFNDFNPNLSPIIGNELFYNSTRVQLKNLK